MIIKHGLKTWLGKPRIGSVTLLWLAVLTMGSVVAVKGWAQDKQAEKLATKVAAAFSNGIRELDTRRLIKGRLMLTIEHTGEGPEFEHKSFRSFAAMDRWMKSRENDEGLPWRMSGDKKISCRRGFCDIGLVDGQMAHSRVFLTKMYYGLVKGRVYIKRLYIIYG